MRVHDGHGADIGRHHSKSRRNTDFMRTLNQPTQSVGCSSSTIGSSQFFVEEMVKLKPKLPE